MSRVNYRNIRAGLAAAIAGWEPFVIDLGTPNVGRRWIVRRAGVLALFATNPGATPGQPGICWGIVTASQGPETLTDATASINLAARGVPIDSTSYAQQLPTAGGFAFVSIASLGAPTVIYPGETLRFTGSLNPSTPQPGPGAASTGQMIAQVEEEIWP